MNMNEVQTENDPVQIPLAVRGERELCEADIRFADEIICSDGKLNFYVESCFDVDRVFGTHVCTDDNDDWLNIYADYDMSMAQVVPYLTLVLCCADGTDHELRYSLSPHQCEMLDRKMSEYCKMPVCEYAEKLEAEIENIEQMQMT